VVNFTELDHPMHLHGFYFRMESKGDGRTDTLYAPDQRRMAVTEVVPPFGTTSLSWYAARPGNWLFHCHYAIHLSHLVALDTENGALDAAMLAHHHSDRPHQMFGLVAGITIAPKGPSVEPAGAPRAIRIVQRERPNVYGSQPGMSYLLEHGPQAADTGALPVPGPVLLLERGKRVAVTIVNQSEEHASVHWHGIELESYPVTVPGWSGSGANILPAIAPHDSLTVFWTPPRAGSHMYHSHFNESMQMGSGLYGPLLVLEPGERFDPSREIVWIVGGRDVEESGFLRVNGTRWPAPLTVDSGRTYRVRIINITENNTGDVALLDGDTPVEWAPIAKDAAPLPPAYMAASPARVRTSVGETYDFLWTPMRAGTLRLEVRNSGQPMVEQRIEVRGGSGR